jgi:hypothetical protein
LSTKNYNIALEFIPLEGERTFLHVRYSYGYGVLAGLAMRIYLATSGQSKVGFTTVGGETANRRSWLEACAGHSSATPCATK